MISLSQWLTSNGVEHRMVKDAILIFDPPPSKVDAHGAAITTELAAGRSLAIVLRARGWAVCSTKSEDQAMKWLAWLGYGNRRHVAERPLLRLPTSYRGGVDLAWLAACVVGNPGVGAVVLAREISAKEGKPVDRWAVCRALEAIGWGSKQREAFSAGLIGAPAMATK